MLSIATNTQWNGGDIIEGTANGTTTLVAYQVGANGGQTVSVNFGNFAQSAVAGIAGVSQGLSVIARNHFSSNNAVTGRNRYGVTLPIITWLDTAITAVNTQRSTFGAAINQLTYAVDNLSNVKVNSEAARSRILDTDYAVETSKLARAQIIQQA